MGKQKRNCKCIMKIKMLYKSEKGTYREWKKGKTSEEKMEPTEMNVLRWVENI